MPKPVWKDRPESQDFPAAEEFLTLLYSARQAGALVARLRKGKVVVHQAKDIFRASGMHLLPSDDIHVAADLKKIAKGKKLSPVLLVRGDGGRNLSLLIADGYHRICAAYHHDYDKPVPCVIVDRPKD